jgi:hypothetical protein
MSEERGARIRNHGTRSRVPYFWLLDNQPTDHQASASSHSEGVKHREQELRVLYSVFHLLAPSSFPLSVPRPQ